MRNKLLRNGLITTLALTGVMVTMQGVNVNNPQNGLNVNTVNKVKAEGPTAAGGATNVFLNFLKEKGPDIITNTIGCAAGGLVKNLATNLLLECGIDLRDGNAAVLDNINKEVQEIKEKLNVVEKKVDQYHAEDIINHVYDYIHFINNNLEPMVTGGLYTLVNEEKAGKLNDKQMEDARVKFYEENLKNKTYKNNNLLATYVTEFAQTITKPNNANNTEGLFHYYALTLGKYDKWTHQEYLNRRNFIAYLDTTLLVATNMARYDLIYRAKNVDEATLNTYKKYLDNLVKAVKDVNQMFKKELTRLDNIENDRIKKHVMTYIPTGNKYANRVATLTPNLEDKTGRNALVAKGDPHYKFDFVYQPDLNLVDKVNKDYVEYKKAFKENDNTYTINKYLKEAGFYANDEKTFENAAGLYRGELYQNRCGLYNHDTELSIAYYNKLGEKKRKDVYKVNVFHDWFGNAKDYRIDNLDNDYYICFIKEGEKELVGNYVSAYYDNVKEYFLVKKFTYQVDNGGYKAVVPCYVNDKF